MKMSLSLKLRLTLWYLLIAAVNLLCFSSLAYFLMANGLVQRDILPVNMRVIQVRSGEGNESDIVGVTDISEQYWENRQDELMTSMVFDGSRLPDSGGSDIFTLPVPDGQLSIKTDVLAVPDDTNEYKTQLLLYRTSDEPGLYDLVIVTQSKNAVIEPLQVFRHTLLYIIPISLIIAGILWLLLVKKLLYPLEAITKATREMKEDSLNKRLPVRTNDELGRLADSMNRMFERLERSMTREKQFAADASHELRTPLTIIAGEVSRALGGVTVYQEQNRQLLEKISLQADRMAALLQKLRFLEQDESTLRLSFEEMDLSVLLREIDSDMQPVAQSKQISLFIRTTESCPIKGDPALLRSLFFNLLDNAFKHTSPGGEIRLVMLKDEYKIIVSVRDNGSGIPEQHLPHIFERFYRVHKTRDGGMGLGLAICKKILDIHYGGISVTSRAGKGTTFIITLPCL